MGRRLVDYKKMKELDLEWIELMKEAKNIGLTKEEVVVFLQKQVPKEKVV